MDTCQHKRKCALTFFRNDTLVEIWTIVSYFGSDICQIKPRFVQANPKSAQKMSDVQLLFHALYSQAFAQIICSSHCSLLPIMSYSGCGKIFMGFNMNCTNVLTEDYVNSSNGLKWTRWKRNSNNGIGSLCNVLYVVICKVT